MSVRLLLATLLTLPWLAIPQAAQAANPPVVGPGQIEVGEPIHLSGTGWTTTAGDAGSVLAFKLDEGSISTKGTVRNPANDTVIGNKTVWAAVQADANGDWEVDLPFPTTENGTDTWEPGDHGIRILTGSMLEGDEPRTALVNVEVVGEPAEPEPTTPSPGDPPAWPHTTLSAGSATAWIENEIAAGDGRQIRIAGRDWTTHGGRGSTIAVKLNRSATSQYTRSGGDIVDHPSAGGDDTIWALITAETDGTFTATLDAPPGLTAGQYLSATLMSGRFDSDDVQRAATTGLLTVGGRPHDGGGGSDDTTTCVPTSTFPTASAAVTTDGFGGVLRLTGAGWCHPAENRGGSVIGVKIDEGSYSRTDTSLHQNKTIWAIVEADPATGELDAEIRLPDGSTSGANGSEPAFVEGAHTLRLLTGSLKPGDAMRTLLTESFVVGSYQPTTLPDPLEYSEDLTSATGGGLTATSDGQRLVVTVPGLPSGAWVALSVYHSDGSPEYPWGQQWLRADDAGRVTVPAASLSAERVKLVAQSGDEHTFGTLLGWTWWGTAAAPPAAPEKEPKPGKNAPEPTPRPAPTTTPTTAPTAAPKTSPITSAYPITGAAASTQPVITPAAPAAAAADLSRADRGKATITVKDGIATVTVPGGHPGEWVHPFVYTDDGGPIAVGWVQLDDQRQIRLDLSALGDGVHTVAVVNSAGSIIGWARTRIGQPKPASNTGEPLAIANDGAVAASTGGSSTMGQADWWLLAAGAAIALGVTAGTITSRKKATA